MDDVDTEVDVDIHMDRDRHGCMAVSRAPFWVDIRQV